MWGVVHATILPKLYWRLGVLKGVTRERASIYSYHMDSVLTDVMNLFQARKGYLLLVVLATAGTAMACVFLLLQNPNHA